MQHLNCQVEHLPVSMLYEAGSWFIGNSCECFGYVFHLVTVKQWYMYS